MFAVGRRPNVNGMDLEKAEVEYTGRGLKVNNFLQTTNPDIYGVGEICTEMQFTHNSDICAKYVFRNALFFD
jgi:pyruvate/2-oxoglutarate dehydrogenase complex dihydrolipoamide dehydrogenase (E3) component